MESSARLSYFNRNVFPQAVYNLLFSDANHDIAAKFTRQRILKTKEQELLSV